LKAAIDNDILFKAACYRLLSDLIGVIPCEIPEVGILGAARFVVRALLGRAKLAGDTAEIGALIDEFFRHAEILEPTTEESRFAAELEFAAQRADINLGTGESQLCAIAIGRSARLVTGDKRAVAAFELLLAELRRLSELADGVICLEQLFVRLLAIRNPADIRQSVCREAGIDRALALSFSCHNDEVGPDSWLEGLDSYISDLRNVAKTILAA
jgi:predicted nucleic acid-binding protein